MMSTKITPEFLADLDSKLNRLDIYLDKIDSSIIKGSDITVDQLKALIVLDRFLDKLLLTFEIPESDVVS